MFNIKRIPLRRMISFDKTIIELLTISMIILVIVLPGGMKVVAALACVSAFVILLYSHNLRCGLYLIISPIVLSSFQNVYLAIASKNMAAFQLEILISLHFLLMITLVFIELLRCNGRIKEPFV